MSLPPGIVYLSKQLPRLFAPAFTVYVATLLAERGFGVAVPAWLTTVACLLSGPVVLTVIVQYWKYIVRRDAAALGAIVSPPAPGSIGGVNMLFANVDDMYPGAPISV
jgi:hypothetical protein